MRTMRIIILLFGCLTFSLTTHSQTTISFSQQHTNGSTATSQCAAYNSFKQQLTSNLCYQSVTIKGTFDTVGVTCNNPTVVTAFANGLNTVTGVYLPCNGNMWHICPRYQGEVWLNPPDSCSGSNCPNPGYIIRPCITNSNWGGVNTATCGGSTQTMEIIFTIGTGPVTTDTIQGAQFVCSGDTTIYHIDTISGVTNYSWTAPAGDSIIGGQGTDSIMVLSSASPGWLKVSGTNVCGTSVLDSVWIDAKPTLVATGAQINGPDSICSGDTVTYTIDTLAGAVSYNWSIPGGGTVLSGQGTNTVTFITGSSGGQLLVSASNGCNATALDSTQVVFDPLPTNPPSIAGLATPCWGDTLTYSTFQAAYASSYTWTVPNGTVITAGQGTVSIVTIIGPNSGAMTVTANNHCGSSQATTMNLTVDLCGQVSIEEVAGGLNVWPNPAEEVLNFSFQTAPAHDLRMEFFDLNGRLILSREVNNARKDFQIDISSLAAGVYAMRVSAGEESGNMRIVKQ